MADELTALRREVAVMANGLMGAVGIPFELTTEVQALAIGCFVDVFQYSAEQAAAFSSDVIEHVSSEDPEDTHKAIVHRGIDGHRQWQAGSVEELRKNVEEIFVALGAGGDER